MSCLENTILEENAHEIFVIELCDNRKFESLVSELFLFTQEQWEEKEYGRPDGDAYDNAFEQLLKWDYEFTLRDPIQVVYAYEKWKTLT